MLEITETTAISDFERCRNVVDQLATLGCVVSIDDFGAGFISLAVAEGVEDQPALETLTKLGCDLAQGFHIGRPLHAAMLDLAADEAA